MEGSRTRMDTPEVHIIAVSIKVIANEYVRMQPNKFSQNLSRIITSGTESNLTS